jgi:hypothetical protein
VRKFILCFLAWSGLAGTAGAGALSEASQASVGASIGIPVAAADASAQFFRDAGQLSVAGVHASGQFTTVVLRGVQSGAELSVQVASKGFEGSALAVGTTITAVASATGYTLMHMGKALVYVPNEAGRSLLHHSRSRQA